MVLLILVVVWGVVLFSWFRTRLRATYGDPLGTFQRRLMVLEHTRSGARGPVGRLGVPAGVARPVAAPRESLAVGWPDEVEHGLNPRRATSRRPPRSPRARARRRETLRRRRDVLLCLVAGGLGSLLLGALPGLHPVLILQVGFDLLVAGYVALLIRLRRLAVERNRKLAYLPRNRNRLAHPPATASAHSVIRATPPLVAGDFDHQGYGVDEGEGGYGGVTLRAVAAN